MPADGGQNFVVYRGNVVEVKEPQARETRAGGNEDGRRELVAACETKDSEVRTEPQHEREALWHESHAALEVETSDARHECGWERRTK